MKKLVLALSAIGLAVSIPTAPVIAQDAAAPERMEGVTWARVVMTKFKTGKRPRAMEIIENYFAKADSMTGKESGIHGIHLNSGEWDVIYVFPMEGGPNDLTWATSPGDIAWMAELTKLAGSKEKAKAILDEFDSLVQSETSYIGHAHPDY